jgi:hypothetical protein
MRAFVDNFKAVTEKKLLAILVLEAMKFCVPLGMDDGDVDMPVELMDANDKSETMYFTWEFSKPSKQTSDRIKWILADMRTSAVVKKLVQDKAKHDAKLLDDQEQDHKDACETPEADGKRKSSEAGGRNPKKPRKDAQPPTDIEPVELEILVGAARRPRTFLDDFIALINFEYGRLHLSTDAELDLQKRVMQMTTRMALQFL